MKKSTRLISLIIVFALIMAIPVSAEEQNPRASSYFAAYRAYCTKLSSTSISVSFQVIGVGTMDVLGASQVKVQRSSDGKNWTTVKTFDKANYSNMTDTDSAVYGSTLSCTVPAGYQYRAVVTFYAKKGTGSAYKTYYTEKV